MKLKFLMLLTVALFAGTGPARAELPEGSPLRIRNCVPTDDLSLSRLKSLRESIRSEFARRGGAAVGGPWADTWTLKLGATDDWVPVIGEEGIMGLDSPRLGMVALIPRAWTQPATATKAGSFDPVDEVEAARALLAGWVEKSVAGIAFRHPPDWDIWVSSPADLGAARPSASFEFDSYTPPLWLRISTRAASGDEDQWFEAGIGYAVLGGYSVLGHGGASANDRYCRAAYFEREGWADPKNGGSRFVARTQLGCTNSGYTHLQDDLLVGIKTAEYSVSGAPDADALRAYDLAWRSLCTVRMALQPLRP